jgi:hypothetical protein
MLMKIRYKNRKIFLVIQADLFHYITVGKGSWPQVIPNQPDASLTATLSRPPTIDTRPETRCMGEG